MILRIQFAPPRAPEIEGGIEPPQLKLLPGNRLRSWPGMLASLALHGGLVSALLLIPAAVPAVQQPSEPLDPFEVRIGDKLYYVVQPPPAILQAGGKRRKDGGQGTGSKTTAAIQAPVENQPGPEPAAAAEPRAFVAPPMPRRARPEVKVALLEPDVKLDREPDPRAIPTAVAWTESHVKMPPKPMVQPGPRPRTPLPSPEEVAPADVTITDPSLKAMANPKLPVQMATATTQAPLLAPQEIGVAADLAGDPVRVFAIGPLPRGDKETLTVPRGNLPLPAGTPGRTGRPTLGAWPTEGNSASRGARTTDPTSGAGHGAADGVGSSASSSLRTAGLGTGVGTAQAGAGTGGGPSASAGRGETGAAEGGAGSGKSGAGIGTAGPGKTAGSASATGNGPGSGPGTGKTGGGPGGEAGVGGSGPGAGAGGGNGDVVASADARFLKSGGGHEAGIDPSYIKITNPSNGVFDAVVVQSGGIDLLEQNRAYLTGQPVYTVYLSMGTVRDWILQYCVPREGNPKPSSGGYVVTLGNPAPISAPYPTLMYRPPVKLRAGERYMLVHGFVTDGGKFDQVRILHHGTPDTDQSLLAALRAWVFRPAKKDGAPVVVEFLLAIPPDQS